MMKRKYHSTESGILRKRTFSLLASICLLLGLAVATSCSDALTPEPFTDPMSRDLTLRFYLPGVVPSTKVIPGTLQSVSPESQIYNVRVWVFNHVDLTDAAAVAAADNQTAIAYTQVDNINWANSGNLPNGSNYYTAQYWADTYTLEIRVNFPGYIVGRKDDKMKFDFYVLANAPSAGVAPDRLTKRGELKNLTFGYTADNDDLFGPCQLTRATWGNTPTVAINGSETGRIGLPISGFFNKDKDGVANGVDLSFLKNNPASLTPAQVAEKLPIVQLERAVSKVRFFFAQSTGMTGASVTKIEILADQIPTQTYVFPREDGTEFVLPGTSYVNKVAEIPGPASADILQLSDPETLKSTSETYSAATAQAYEDALDAAVGTKVNTQRYVYLRETDKDLTCKIYYKLAADGTVLYKEFKLSDSPGYVAATTNLHRNHYWTVYAYFKGGALYIKPLVMPWDDGGSYEFTTPGTAYVTISDKSQSLFGYGWSSSNDNPWYTVGKNTEWYFRRLDKTNPTTEDDWKDWVNSQIVVAPGANVANTPIFANRIELHTNGFTEPLRLKLTNTDDFYLVVYHDDTTDNTYEVIDSANGAEIPATVAANGITYFYVAPKEGATHLNKTTSAYLITANTGQKIPFNPGAFPGSNDNSEIHFYSVSQDTFKAYYSSLPANVRAYGKGSVSVNIL